MFLFEKRRLNYQNGRVIGTMVAMLEEDTEGDAQVLDQTYLLMCGAFTGGFHRQVSKT